MKTYELERLPLDIAAETLIEEGCYITTLETLKDFIIYNIQNDNLYLAAHVLDCIRNSYAEYWSYDYNMGTLEEATPIESIDDLRDFCEEPYKVMARIHSLGGEIDEVEVIDERLDTNGNTIYIVRYKDVTCTAIYNPFVGQFYADDKYGKVTI